MRDAITAEAQRLADIDNDIETIKAVGEVFNALDDAMRAIGEPRIAAIGHLQALGWSYNRIVDETGLSKTRVAQLAQEARRRGLQHR